MGEFKKVIVAEDELTNSILLKRLLTKAGYSVVVAHNGLEALNLLEREPFDALLTDWMMPQLDGIELIQRVRERINPIPLIIMITALVSEGAKNYALESGADDYIAKPIDVDDLLTRLKDGLARKNQDAPFKIGHSQSSGNEIQPAFIGVTMASSTGGPPALIEIFKQLDEKINAAFFVVQHGPPWMLETFSQRLQKESKLNVFLAVNGLEPAPGSIFIAPGDKHMRIEPKTFRIQLDEGPKENFVRPAADPLFRSVSNAFGSSCIAVILTGLGRDGAQGAYHVSSNSGIVLVQDPETAIAPSMPKTIVEMGINHTIVPLNDMARTIADSVITLSAKPIS